MGFFGGNLEDNTSRAFQGVDRGFIFFELPPGLPWKGLTDVEESEDGYSTESYFVDGRKIGHRHYKGNYHASVTSYDDPFTGDRDIRDVSGFSYRENYQMGGSDFYRLHIIHEAQVRYLSSTKQTYNVADPAEATTYSWEVDSLDTELKPNTGLRGSHLILDSRKIFPWSLRDIENILYDEGRIPSIDEMFDIFSEMNLLIVDHGDGTWSAIGHESMVQLLDPYNFVIETPSIEFDDEDPRTFDIYDYIRDERWLE